jgi:hypothetical protein
MCELDAAQRHACNTGCKACGITHMQVSMPMLFIMRLLYVGDARPDANKFKVVKTSHVVRSSHAGHALAAR